MFPTIRTTSEFLTENRRDTGHNFSLITTWIRGSTSSLEIEKDNFWMMGDTGPCGPCSELHVDLTPAGDTRGVALVNKGDARCIEIWNLVFIQFNANPDGTFIAAARAARRHRHGLRARHLDHPGHEKFHRFRRRKISNYETDIFRPIFDEIGKAERQANTDLRSPPTAPLNTEQEKIDVAFRVIADHIRTLSFAIADGIQPGNTDRDYVLRRILRRAVRYGRSLGFHEPFFYRAASTFSPERWATFPRIARKAEARRRSAQTRGRGV